MTTSAYDTSRAAAPGPPPLDAPSLDAPPSWHDDALRLGAALDHVAAALVVGRDGGAAAWAALGAARAQSARRRVAVADLVGDAAALAGLGEGDEPVGISDSFFYGVTLNKIARPADAAGSLFVLPSGSEPVAVAEVLSSDRWRRLVAGFREAGALLLLAARADAPGLDVLATRVDGLVVVGDLGGLLPDAPAPLMVIPSPTPRRPRGAPRTPAAPNTVPAAAPNASPGAADAPAADPLRAADPLAALAAHSGAAALNGAAPAEAATYAPGTFADELARATAAMPPATSPGTASPAAPLPAVTRRPGAATPATARSAAPARRGRRALALVGAVAAVAVAGALLWTRTSARPAAGPAAGRVAAPSPGAATVRPPASPSARDSVPAAPAAPPAGPVDLAAALTVRNPADSARAAAYAVHLVSANTPEGASLPAGADAGLLPELAPTPQLENGAPWWRLLVGAYPTRQRAESALVALQRRGVVSSGAVIRAPYALLVADRLPPAEAPARVEALARRGVPTYPLSRGDGTVALYAGAFERPADAAYLAQALQAAGVAPALVYRTGTSTSLPAGGER